MPLVEVVFTSYEASRIQYFRRTRNSAYFWGLKSQIIFLCSKSEPEMKG